MLCAKLWEWGDFEELGDGDSSCTRSFTIPMSMSTNRTMKPREHDCYPVYNVTCGHINPMSGTVIAASIPSRYLADDDSVVLACASETTHWPTVMAIALHGTWVTIA